MDSRLSLGDASNQNVWLQASMGSQSIKDASKKSVVNSTLSLVDLYPSILEINGLVEL